MLVLTRRVGEEIVIEGTIRVKVVGVRGKRIRIGVSAPDTVRVDRAEIDVLRSSSGLEDGLREEAFPYPMLHGNSRNSRAARRRTRDHLVTSIQSRL